MSLRDWLAEARTEEDVKDAYIKAVGLKGASKGLIDIQHPQIWFEAKFTATPPLLMFAQLLVYVRRARRRGQVVPPFLAVVDRDQAAILPTVAALPVFDDESIVWPGAASRADAALAGQIKPYLDDKFTTYPIATLAGEFADAVRGAVRDGEPIRIPITPDNLRQVFDKWVAMIGQELDVTNPVDYATIFFADIMHDGATSAYASVGADLVTLDNKPAFHLRGAGGLFPVGNVRAYRDFWSIYERPPEEKHRRWLLERRDSLLPLDEQKFKGAFYTPLHIVDKAYDQLAETLGEGWQERYIVWDMCAGVGNLEAKHNHLRNVFMSTLDEVDVKFMRTVPAFAGAEIFQYDYLNDDVTDFGEIDYSLSNKVPLALRQAIADAKAGKDGAKPILVLINPPYAEATSGGNTAADVAGNSKPGVAKTRFAEAGMSAYGKAKNELFMQFIARVHQEIPTAFLAMFSKLKYISTPTLKEFRSVWRAKFLDGFVFHSRTFEGLKGEYPIGFLIWDTGKTDLVKSVAVDVLVEGQYTIGEKTFFNYDGKALLTDWITRPRANKQEVVPLKNAIVPATATKDLRGRYWSSGALGWLNSGGNDFQHAVRDTFVFSSGYSSGRGLFITEQNLWQAAVVFSVRRLIKPTWLNDRDQFLQPSHALSDEFKTDCLVWMLFNGSNLSAGADGLEWDGRTWSLTNHFVPFAESAVGATGRYESDFMVRYLAGLAFSSQAQAVLDQGRALFARFHDTSFPRLIRDELKLGRADAGWYQVRSALKAYGETELTDFDLFNAAYKALSDKLRPMVYELGFLPG